jgi:pyruvate ferredoxin oxidoreductase delta subunit
MMEQVNIKKCVDEYFVKNDIYEFPAFCIARQGGRTALEILTRAFILEGKYAYLGQNLSGLRGMGSNSMIIRFADSPVIPPGISVNRPKGVLLMHESLTSSKQGLGSLMSQMKRVDVLQQFYSGILMVCTSKSPEELAAKYPFPFQGTVATVDAEAIFSKRVDIQPAPSGITALGLFVAATGDMLDIESVKEATMAHERLGQKVREQNVLCLMEAYEKAQVVKDIKIGERGDSKKVAQKFGMSGGRWRKSLPVCDLSKCSCAECMSAYFCPEAAITWKNDIMNIDYKICKACGTCAVECLHDAITMEKAGKVLAAKPEKKD